MCPQLELSILLAAGAAIGLLGSVLGIGGGIFIVPLLVLAIHIPIQQAIAVSLVAIVATSSAVASVNIERGLTNMRLGIVLETTTAAGSIAGAWLVSRLPAAHLQFLFALALFPVAGILCRRGWVALHQRAVAPSAEPSAAPAGGLSAAFYDPALGRPVHYAVRRAGSATAVSFLAGTLSGLLGIGGGIIQVPVMNLLCGMPIKAATATSNFLIGVSAAASAWIFFRQGLIRPELAAPLVVGVLAGSWFGIRVLYRIHAARLQLAFAMLMTAVAVLMLYKLAY